MADTPKWFKPVAIVALLWNLMGCAAFAGDLMLTPEDVAKLDAAQQAMYAARPAWSVASTGLAVLAGALGCIGLLLGKRWALPVFVASLVGVIAQDASMLSAPGGLAAAGATAAVLQGIVLAVAVALILLARRASSAGWLR